MTASAAWENTKTQKGKEKARKPVIIFIDRFSERCHDNLGFNIFLKLVATLTLVVENFSSQMHSRNDMPAALEFAYLFVPPFGSH